MRNDKIESGVTLVALVVTIVILIILATISVTIVLNENGMINQAQKARQHQLNAEAEDYEKIQMLDNSIKDYITSKENEKPIQSAYVQKGLMVHYDGINNTGSGHDGSTTTWTNLASDTYHATIHGATWQNDSLSFDGLDDWATIDILNYPYVTIEAVVSHGNTSKTMVVNNFEGAGCGFTSDLKSGYNCFLYHCGGYQNLPSDTPYITNKIYSLSGSFNGNQGILYENGRKFVKSNTGSIASSSSPYTLAANAYTFTSTDGVYNERIYSVRIYNRALTDDEVLQNYEIDKQRFSFLD